MSPRKPRGLSWRSFVEQQIREAQRRGEFDDLPGAGRPIPAEVTSDDPMAWVAAKLKREGVSADVLLPPSLALAKEVEELPGKLDALCTEGAVRAHLADLNARIVAAHRRPPEGPPLRFMARDVDSEVAHWHARRASD
jgi:hypothetical protein